MTYSIYYVQYVTRPIYCYVYNINLQLSKNIFSDPEIWKDSLLDYLINVYFSKFFYISSFLLLNLPLSV